MACGDYPPFGLVPIPASGVSLELQGMLQRSERDVLRITGISASYLGQDALIAELQAEVARMKTAHAAAYAVDFQRCQEIARLRTEVESLRVERDYERARFANVMFIRWPWPAPQQPGIECVALPIADYEAMLREANRPAALPPAPPIFNAIKAHR